MLKHYNLEQTKMKHKENNIIFCYEEKLCEIIKKTGFNSVEHSKREFDLAKLCTRSPRIGRTGEEQRKAISDARASINTDLLKQSYVKRIKIFLPFLDSDARILAQKTILTLGSI